MKEIIKKNTATGYDSGDETADDIEKLKPLSEFNNNILQKYPAVIETIQRIQKTESEIAKNYSAR